MGDTASVIDAQRKALLAAVAQQGAAGKAAFDAQIKESEASRQEAVKAATERAGVINAPDAAVSTLAQQAASIGDRYKADAEAGATAYGQESERLSHANSDYMGQVSGAIPIAESYAKAVAAEKEQEEGSPLSQLVDRLGGQTMAKQQLAALAARQTSDIRSTPLKDRTDGAVFAKWRRYAPSIEDEAISRVAQAGGTTRDELRAFLGDQAPGFKKPPTSDERKMQNRAKIIQTTGYKKWSDYLTGEIEDERAKDPGERQDISVIKARLRQELLNTKWATEHPYIADQLLRDYL